MTKSMATSLRAVISGRGHIDLVRDESSQESELDYVENTRISDTTDTRDEGGQSLGTVFGG